MSICVDMEADYLIRRSETPDQILIKFGQNSARIRTETLRLKNPAPFVKIAGIGRVAEPWLTEVIGRIGYDLIWFDMEHRPYGVDKIDPLSLACRATGIDPDGVTTPVMHACGHDTHMAALVGAVEQLAAHRDAWSGSLLAVCQSAEELGEPVYTAEDLRRRLRS